tara:strand:+ start:7354 stop:7971 length:618 start_codon:yes stop_codon:yes gene_type:complete
MRPVSTVKTNQFDVLLRNIIRLKVKRKRNQIVKRHKVLLERGFRESEYFTSSITDPFERPHWKPEKRTYVENEIYIDAVFGLLSALGIQHRQTKDQHGRPALRIRGTNTKITIRVFSFWFVDDNCSFFTHSPVWMPEIGNGQWESISVDNNYDTVVESITQLLFSNHQLSLIILEALLKRMKPEQLMQANIIKSKINALQKEHSV